MNIHAYNYNEIAQILYNYVEMYIARCDCVMYEERVEEEEDAGQSQENHSLSYEYNSKLVMLPDTPSYL